MFGARAVAERRRPIRRSERLQPTTPEAKTAFQIGRSGFEEITVWKDLRATGPIAGDPTLADTDTVGKAVKLVAAGVREFGFKGQIPRLRRRVGRGAVQSVYLTRQSPFRPPMFAVGLSVVPAALLEGWEAVAPRALEMFNKARNPIGGLDYGRDLNHADGHQAPGWHAPRTMDEAEEVAAEVIRQFERSGLPWLEQHSDPTAVVQRACEHNADPSHPPLGGRLVAAALLEVLPSSDPKVMDLVDSTLFVMSYWQERMKGWELMGLGPATPDESVGAKQETDLDNWLASRLIAKAGFTPDRSSWPERTEVLTRQMSQRDEAQQSFQSGLRALGFDDGYRDDDEARVKLAKLLGPKLSAHFEQSPPSEPAS